MAFPWGWLLVHLGVGMLFKQEVDRWVSNSLLEQASADAQLVASSAEQDGAESEGSDSEDAEDSDGDVDSDLEAVGA